MQSDLVNAFFSVPVLKNHQKQFAFTRQGQKYIFTFLPQGYSLSLALCQNLVRKNLDKLSFPLNITLVYYIVNIMPLGPNEEKVNNHFELIGDTYVHQRIGNKSN